MTHYPTQKLMTCVDTAASGTKRFPRGSGIFFAFFFLAQLLFLFDLQSLRKLLTAFWSWNLSICVGGQHFGDKNGVFELEPLTSQAFGTIFGARASQFSKNM